MSNTIIKVDDLGKSYLIGHERQQGYMALRDVVAKNTKGFLKGIQNAISGKQLTGGQEIEEFWALKNVSFEIKEGEAVGIIGRNGAGKSTLLKLLSRITEPTKGRIELNGRVASLLEVGTGFHPELSGRENIFLNGAILGMSRAEIKSKFDEIVDFSGVEKFLDTPVKHYSSGMYVRLAFAVAAHLEPEILVVDEVLAVGDAEFQKKCLGKMNDVTKTGRTVIFVSHQMGTIVQLCSKTILLNKGGIEAIGDSTEIVQRYSSSSNSNNNVYEPTDTRINKPNYFTKIYTTNTRGEKVSDFSFDEEIVLNFEFVANNYNDNLLVGIGLLDKYQNRVTTILQNVAYFDKIANKYTGNVVLPASVIAPNNYSFLFVLWTKNSTIYDNIESICPIKIYDNGTDLALYEGADYGSIILHVKWNRT